MTITVFLADDHKIVRDGLKAIIELQNDIEYVGGADDGLQALKKIEALRPDIVVMDITMPNLNGIEVARQVLQVCPDSQVVILSMHSTMEYVSRALQAGARGFILKETAGTEVIDAVRSVYAGHRYLSPKIEDQVIRGYLDLCSSGESLCPMDNLSSRERKVLQLIVEGRSRDRIAEMLSISANTVSTYRTRLMRKLNIDTIPELVRFAIQHGLTPLD